MDPRRIDCEIHDEEDEEDGQPCLNTSAFRLFSTGIIFTRPYGARCHRKHKRFDATPDWTRAWLPWPPE